MAIIDIDGEAGLDRALGAPLAVLMKDSPRCIQCAAARRQLRKLEKHTAKQGRGVEIFTLNVLEHRPLSDRLAKEFGVRHESPQAFVLQRGQLLWSGSHFALTWRKLAAELDAQGMTAAPGAEPNQPK